MVARPRVALWQAGLSCAGTEACVPPRLAGGLLTGLDGGELVGLEPLTGRERWRFPVGPSAHFPGWTVSDDAVVVRTVPVEEPCTHQAAVFDPQTGVERSSAAVRAMRCDEGVAARPVAHWHAGLLGMLREGGYVALDPDSGEERWRVATAHIGGFDHADDVHVYHLSLDGDW